MEENPEFSLKVSIRFLLKKYAHVLMLMILSTKEEGFLQQEDKAQKEAASAQVEMMIRLENFLRQNLQEKGFQILKSCSKDDIRAENIDWPEFDYRHRKTLLKYGFFIIFCKEGLNFELKSYIDPSTKRVAIYCLKTGEVEPIYKEKLANLLLLVNRGNVKIIQKLEEKIKKTKLKNFSQKLAKRLEADGFCLKIGQVIENVTEREVFFSLIIDCYKDYERFYLELSFDWTGTKIKVNYI